MTVNSGEWRGRLKLKLIPCLDRAENVEHACVSVLDQEKQVVSDRATGSTYELRGKRHVEDARRLADYDRWAKYRSRLSYGWIAARRWRSTRNHYTLMEPETTLSCLRDYDASIPCMASRTLRHSATKAEWRSGRRKEVRRTRGPVSAD